jgi:hypothetical protein
MILYLLICSTLHFLVIVSKIEFHSPFFLWSDPWWFVNCHGIFVVIISGAKYFIDITWSSKLTFTGFVQSSNWENTWVLYNQQCCEHLNLWCILFRRFRKQGKQISVFSRIIAVDAYFVACETLCPALERHWWLRDLFDDFVSFSTWAISSFSYKFIKAFEVFFHTAKVRLNCLIVCRLLCLFE